MSVNKQRLYSLLAIIVGLPLSVAGASSQSFIIGVFFGCLLAIGIDNLIDSFRTKAG